MPHCHPRDDDHAWHDPDIVLNDRLECLVRIEAAQSRRRWNCLMCRDDRAGAYRRPITDLDVFGGELVNQNALADEDPSTNSYARHAVKTRPHAVERNQVCEALQDDSADKPREAKLVECSRGTTRVRRILVGRGSA